MDNICAVEGCDRPVRSAGLCRSHYQSAWEKKKRASRPPIECVCEWCGETFETTRKNVKYHPPSQKPCRQQAQSAQINQYQKNKRSAARAKEPQRSCIFCGEPLIDRDPRAIYCKKTPEKNCKESHRGQREQTQRKLEKEGRLCLVCGNPILLSRNAQATTCSDDHSILYQNLQKKRERESSNRSLQPPCEVCGEEFTEPVDPRTKYHPKCKEDTIKRIYDERWREKSPGYNREYLHGITHEQFDIVLAEQDGRCRICKTDTPKGKGGWHTDHDHIHCPGRGGCPECIRGLLCHNCNLGKFGDDPALARAAADYWESGERPFLRFLRAAADYLENG